MTYEIESASFRDRVLQNLHNDVKEIVQGFIAEIVYGDTVRFMHFRIIIFKLTILLFHCFFTFHVKRSTVIFCWHS